MNTPFLCSTGLIVAAMLTACLKPPERSVTPRAMSGITGAYPKDSPKDSQSAPPAGPVLSPATATEPSAEAGSAAALMSLREALAKNPSSLKSLEVEDFATVSLTASDANTAKTLLWDNFKQRELSARQSEIKDSVVKAAGQTMRYRTKTFGNKPVKGRSLYVSLHGGGATAASVNDEQWQNQINLYQPAEGLYLAPRAPTDTWDLWQQGHIDALLDRLITNYVLTGEVDPDRIYFMGYSAGGDGVYQLGPRMADRLAAASMSAGHPGDASPLGLRNIGFAIHCGGNDAAFDRNKLAGDWGRKLDELERAEPGSFRHQVNVVPGKPHWMDLVDAESVPWMGGFTRNPFPKKVGWHQDDVNHNRFYWLFAESPKTGSEAVAEIAGQSITLKDNMPGALRVRLNDDMIDLSKEIRINRNGKETTVKALRTLQAILRTLGERGDPRSIYSVDIMVP